MLALPWQEEVQVIPEAASLMARAEPYSEGIVPEGGYFLTCGIDVQAGLAAQLGNVEYARPRRFREKLEQWLKTIRTMWPECPARLNNAGAHLAVRPAIAIHRREGSDVCA